MEEAYVAGLAVLLDNASFPNGEEYLRGVMKLTIRDNLWVEADDEYPIIKSLMSYAIPGARFTPSYKTGHWDGTQSLAGIYKGRTRFPVGLLELVLSNDPTATVTDQRYIPGYKDLGWADEQQVELDPHQEEAVGAAISAGRGLIQYPTGTGKGRIIGETVRRLNVPTLILCDKKDLLHQLVREVNDALGGDACGIIGDGEYDVANVTVATWQTIHHWRNPKGDEHGDLSQRERATMNEMLNTLKTFNAVIVDEAHHLEADSMRGVLNDMPNAYYRLGFSATAFKSFKGKQENRAAWLKVQGATGPPVAQMTIQQGVDSGRIVPADIIMIHGADDPVDHSKDITWNYAKEYESGVINNVDRNMTVVKLAAKLMKKGPTVVLVSRVDHGWSLMAGLSQWLTPHYQSRLAPRYEFVHGGTPTRTRQNFYEAFKRGDIPLLIIGKLGDEALDLPNIQYLIMAGGGKATHVQVQRIGRALRAFAGKTRAMVFDFFDKGKYLEAHSKGRRRAYKAEPAYTLVEVEMADVL